MKKNIPALLKKRNVELEFDGIQTQNFNMCPEASKLFRDMITSVRNGETVGEIGPTTAPDKTKVYMSIKPESTRKQQFKQYTGL